MDDLDLHLALEALRTNPAAHAYHERITRGMQAIEHGTLTSFERDALRRLLARFPVSPPADPIAALIAAFQNKLPNHDPAAVATAIHALVAGDAAQLDGKSLALTIEQRGQTQIANLAERNVVMGDLNQLNMSVHIPIPDARFDHLMQAAFQRQTHERITKAAQQIESDRLLNLRLQGFVGRVNELVAIREQIAAMRPTGGYVLIKAAAGEGKSSSIAKLIQEAGIAQTPHHFIALTTGREYQLGLLRAVVAQLILKHHLTVSYFPEESYPAMKAELARILDELSKQGIEETIYLDGLDQLQPEIDSSCDLSFLPPHPPPGIVIVLGSRPDETLKPLEILHRVDYDLPPLSEADALALWRSVQPGVADSLLHDLYAALKGNALFVHLAADTMRDQSVVDATSLIRQIGQNPSNLFGITLERIKNRSEHRWPTIWKPMLALLLVAQEPLQLDVLGDLLNHDHDTMQDAVWVLGGLVSQGIDQRVGLHHLMFRQYLMTSVFNQREIKRWQQELANWCAIDLDAIWTNDRDPIEHARRVYARHHYVTHLALAENWTTLWQVLDTGDYGEHKTRFDPSTRLYALDLDRGRESAIKAGQSTEEHIQNLPRLWKYSLLRTSLTSRVDQWPDEVFEVLAMVGRAHEALERIELLSSTDKQLSCWIRILPWCNEQQQRTIAARLNDINRHLLGRDKMAVIRVIEKATAARAECKLPFEILDTALRIAQTIDNPVQRIGALGIIAEVTATSNQYKQAFEILDTALRIAQTIDNPVQRIGALGIIAEATATCGQREYALEILDTALTNAQTIDHPFHRDDALGVIAEVMTACGDIDRALTVAHSIKNPEQRAETLAAIAKATAIQGDIGRAMTIAHSIKNRGKRDDALGVIAEARATRGDIDRALTIAHSIKNPEQRAETLGVIAEARAIQGDIDHALTITQSIYHPWHRVNTLRTIVEATATRGDIDCALTIAQTINHPVQRVGALRAIAEAKATQGDIDHALIIAQSIDNADQRVRTICTIAEAMTTRGQHKQAFEILNTTLTIAQSIDNIEQRAETLAAIAEATATRGDIDRALAIPQSIKNRGKRDDALGVIAKATATRGDIDRALAIAHSIDHPRHRIDALSVIAKATATRGDIDRALAIAHSMENTDQRVRTVYSIAEAMATHGQHKQALEVLNTTLTLAQPIDNPRDRVKALCTIAEATATHGDIDRSFTIAQSIDHPWYRVKALRTIAEATATHGDIDRSLTIAQSIDHPWYRVKALCAIAEATATCSQQKQALEILNTALTIAHSIDNTDQRFDALCTIAEVMTACGDIDRALTIAQSMADPNQRFDTLCTIAEAMTTHDQQKQALEILNTALTIAHSIDNTDQRFDALCTIAMVTATHGAIDRALTIAQSIGYVKHRAKTFSMILLIVQSDTEALRIIRHEWFRSTRVEDLWIMASFLPPLIEDNPWLGTAILEEEGWVNQQLKRLG